MDKTRICARCGVEKPLNLEYFLTYHGYYQRFCRRCHLERVSKLYNSSSDYKDKHDTKRRETNDRLRTGLLEHYSDMKMVCACCGYTDDRFLTIDHINNDGAEHRKTVRQPNMYRWIRQNGYPPGFQVLCSNCNSGKGKNKGICPHTVPRFPHEIWMYWGEENIPKVLGGRIRHGG